MNKIFRYILSAGLAAVVGAAFTGCEKDNLNDLSKYGISNLENPKDGQTVSRLGETVTVSFTADGAWTATLGLEEGEKWARVAAQNNNSEAGKGSIRLVFEKNSSADERAVDLWISVDGHKRTVLCTFTQAGNSVNALSETLNKAMHERLLTDYLWNTEYKALDEKGEIEMMVNYDEFLNVNLTKMGDANIEDGGFYREYSVNAGKRYIYSYISEIGGSSASYAPAAPESKAQTKASATMGLGMGPTLASAYSTQTDRCLVLGYVYKDSPADKAGLKRGDLIVGVNGARLDASNYSQYQWELYTSTSGTYSIDYGRYDSETGTKLVESNTVVTAAAFELHPIIFASLFQNEDKTINIGYIVLESFELGDHDMLKAQLEQMKTEGIKDLILDLRFNPGGSVAECRYLMSAIVGAANYDKTFAKMTYNDGSTDVWSFGYGDPKNSDNLGQAPDLGLNSLHVICSENTGSASEIVINSLKGIDFPVTTYGSRTEGKNVGMEVSYITANGRRFEYAPITFRVSNAKGEGDYADGIPVDKMVNNQNSNWSDDIDASFPYSTADWELAARADASVIWAISRITEGKDPDFAGTKSAMQWPAGIHSHALTPVENTPVPLRSGRYGNLLY